MTYKKLGLKCGIEIHQQLEGRKLFCNCPTLIRDEEPDFSIRRKLRAVAGEHGKIDVAAAQEQLRNKTFVYNGYWDTTCLVETDSEPPHTINQNSLYTSLQFCKLVKSNISQVVQVMRKTVVDGSNTSGFQRTALIAREGKIETSEGDVRIANISLEEDSCKIIDENENEKIYSLDRLGIPLIEIGTEPDIKSPKQCLESAKRIGLLLRSLPGIKRGLGTIRQDVNVSIKEGTRIEIKGAQDLKMIPTYVELEMKRQEELVKIKKELHGLRLNALKIIDCSTIMMGSEAKIVKNCFEKEGKVLGIKLHGFASYIGRELQPNYRLGTEFSGRAKVRAGIKGIFHSDELPNYGISDKEVKLLKKKMKCTAGDAFVIVATNENKAKIALQAVYERAQEVLTGVPKEVRKANTDGTSTYMRPMPGAARMYPETDVPLIRPDKKDIELPELLENKFIRFAKEYKLSKDLAEFIAKSNKVLLFEELANKYKKQKPAFIAETLTSTLLDIKRQYNLDPNKLTDQQLRDLFQYLAEDKIHKDIVLDVLIDMIQDKFNLKNYESLSTEDLHHTITEIIKKNKNAPMGALMGMCMKQLAGKASGKIISEAIKKIISKGHK